MSLIMKIKNRFFLSLAKLPMPSRCIRPLFVKWGEVNVLNYKNTFIGSNVEFDTINPGLITISDGVVITTGCVILTHFLNTRDHKFEYGRVFIGEKVFIGCNTVICKSVEIGKQSVIGAGSVVTKNIPNNEVWAGNPAKYIRSYIK